MNLEVIGGLVAILGGGGVIGWWRATRAGRQRAEAGWDAILGKPETKDRAGGQMEPAQPGLVHRVSEVEKAVSTLAEVLATQKELNELVLTLQREQVMHGVRLTSLERNQDERVAIREESAAQWRAVADQNVIDGEVTE